MQPESEAGSDHDVKELLSCQAVLPAGCLVITLSFADARADSLGHRCRDDVLYYASLDLAAVLQDAL